eukprot:CAMPEP_0184728864 /NCGR_PEP_ID=MMETSP0314-20130426/42171_1 /TAXON_ID=38298 /ORGANISM="Rhodella maculata, Strain CCMP 736" /LENGTH=75 /DNA_ID=CAMNT_0027194795 /DNA_START=19 /DNA_END=247 /DNA_ORIENTATION=-
MTLTGDVQEMAHPAVSFLIPSSSSPPHPGPLSALPAQRGARAGGRATVVMMGLLGKNFPVVLLSPRRLGTVVSSP